MNASMDRRHLKVAIRNVSGVLRRVWDPIGHGQIPDLPNDEYDSYAPHLLSMIAQGASDASIAEYLQALEGETVGAVSAAGRHEVARQIRLVVSDSDE